MAFYDSLTDGGKPAAFYSESFRMLLYAHLDFIRDGAKQVITVEAATAFKYRGNLKGLLASHRVPGHLHWVTMKINDLANDYRDIESVRRILVPDSVTIDSLFTRFSAKKR